MRFAICVSIEEKHFNQVWPRKSVSTEFGREEFRPIKNVLTLFDRGKTFLLSLTEELFWPGRISNKKKNISTVFDRGKNFRPRSFFYRKKNNSTAFDAGFSRLRSVSTVKIILTFWPSKKTVFTKKNFDCGKQFVICMYVSIDSTLCFDFWFGYSAFSTMDLRSNSDMCWPASVET